MTDTARSREMVEPEPDEAAEPSEPKAEPAPLALRPYSNVQYVFDAESSDLGSWRRYLQDAWDRRRFAVALAKSELRGPRASTTLGEIWSVLDPMFQAAIYWFLITVIRGGKGGAAVNNPRLAMIMSGIFLFSFTSSAMGEGGRAITRNKGLILNSTFPRALLPAASMYKALMALAPAMLVYAVVHLLLGRPLGGGLFLLPMIFFFQVLISGGLALIMATLTVYIRDMSNVLEYIMRIMLFSTPILYPVAQLPTAMQKVLSLNPIFNVFSAYQTVFNGGMPKPFDLFMMVLWSSILPLLGFRVFVSRERGFAMRL